MYIVIILVLIILFWYCQDRRERFMNMHVAEFSDQLPLGGYEEGNNNREIMKEYRLVKPMRKKMVKLTDLLSQKWETRLPLVKHRYSYDDKKYKCSSPVQATRLPDKARLKELPLELVNRWNATADARNMSIDDWPNYGLRNINCKKNKIYTPIRTLVPINPYTKPIDGYNPSDILPAQYADRSKSSTEYLLGIDVLNESGYGPTEGILPWEV